MDYRINKALGVRAWHYEDGVSIGIYQKIGSNPGTMAKTAVAFERNPDGTCSLLLNEDVLRQTEISVKTVSWGTIEGYTEKPKTKICVTDILWDAPKSAKLPTKLTIDITPDTEYLLEDIDGYAENLCNYLSNTYGYCIRGLAVSREETEIISTEKKGA